VSDTGIGLAPETQEKLFQRFEQGSSSTSRQFGGSGLGLAIVSDIVEAYGGRLEMANANSGLAVTIYLPRPG
jgi:signal transduction histidine kinase